MSADLDRFVDLAHGQDSNEAVGPSEPRPPADISPGIYLISDVVGAVLPWLVWSGSGVPFPLVASLTVVLLITLAAGGHYRDRLTLSFLADLPHLVQRCAAAVAIAVAAHLLLTADSLERADVLWLLSTVVAVVALRWAVMRLVQALRRRRRLGRRTLLLGAGVIGRRVATAMQDHPEYGSLPIGFLDATPLMSDVELPVPVMGHQRDLARIIREKSIDQVVVAFASLREQDVVHLIRTCDRLDCEILFVPRLFELQSMSTDMEQINGIPLVRLRRAAFRSHGWRLKRLIDVAFAAVGLVVATPLLLAVGASLRLLHGPGVIYRQERVGVDGRTFDVLKFRTLWSTEDAELQWTLKDDPRLTIFTRLLRRTSVDELPQLINVVKGDMSLVGPRPERPHFVQEFGDRFPHYVARHRVPSGLTGWAQVHGLRGDTSIDDRARFDNYYIENWSLWLDAKILMRTAVSLLKGAG